MNVYCYTPKTRGKRFLERAGIFLNLSNEPEVIEEAREIGLQDNEQQFTQDTANLIKHTDQFRSTQDPTKWLKQFEQLQSSLDPLAKYREQIQSVQDLMKGYNKNIKAQLGNAHSLVAGWLKGFR
ncbi:MAG: hypothetical protein HC840_26265 [Leptolyngbyaceae cyanobacterium RM2_2_4]|nr:hypothetical protein [Leptolyngbyaceae cyanobacterium SM1_4_3]NJN89736.1 hypothetical protein [Leptolyngbyaceae cyanobacterium SL_5_14]NJO52320.1 hypothetical protein [Leptolyngbyaceae cyanobacterium RM2_2_4]NJO66547.1 hypothetical protein [Leptolyngbyaceae cyanobacterium RM1_405_57]